MKTNRYLSFHFEDTTVFESPMGRVETKLTSFGGVVLKKGSGRWFYACGVNPGDVVGEGKNRLDALADFREEYLTILADILSEVRSSYIQEFDTWVHQKNKPNLDEWMEVVGPGNSIPENLIRGSLVRGAPRIVTGISHGGSLIAGGLTTWFPMHPRSGWKWLTQHEVTR